MQRTDMQALLEDKQRRLIRILEGYDNLAVALSGGVDSAMLLAEARDVLGKRLIAVTARSPIHSEQELFDAAKLAADLEVSHLIVDSDELNMTDFLANTPLRCYICKGDLFGKLWTLIREKGFTCLAHGANLDDRGDYRPGLKAAEEMGVVAPLIEAGFTKADIRFVAKARGLPVWNKPAMACMATRIPYGSPITLEAIEQIKQAEQLLAAAGFIGSRVRHHGDVASIEIPLAQLPLLIGEPLRHRVARQLRKLGFAHVCVNLEGYVSGSMNRTLDNDSGWPIKKGTPSTL